MVGPALSEPLVFELKRNRPDHPAIGRLRQEAASAP